MEKEIAKNFCDLLRKFQAKASMESKETEKNLNILIQGLIDARIEPDEFYNRLERLFNPECAKQENPNSSVIIDYFKVCF